MAGTCASDGECSPGSPVIPPAAQLSFLLDSQSQRGLGEWQPGTTDSEPGSSVPTVFRSLISGRKAQVPLPTSNPSKRGTPESGNAGSAHRIAGVAGHGDSCRAGDGAFAPVSVRREWEPRCPWFIPAHGSTLARAGVSVFPASFPWAGRGAPGPSLRLSDVCRTPGSRLFRPPWTVTVRPPRAAASPFATARANTRDTNGRTIRMTRYSSGSAATPTLPGHR